MRKGLFDAIAMGLSGGPDDESTSATRGAAAADCDGLVAGAGHANAGAGPVAPGSAGTTA